MNIDLILLLVVSSILAIYLVGSMYDGYQIRRLIKAVLANSPTHCGKLYTSSGRLLLSHIDALRYRLDALAWEVSVPQPKLSARDLVRSLPAIPLTDPSDAGQSLSAGFERDQKVLSAFVERVFRLTLDGFRARAIALVLPVAECGDLPSADKHAAGVRVWSHGVGGARWEGQLRTALSPWLERGDRCSLGIRDSSSRKALSEEFSPYGFPFTVVLPLEWDERSLDGNVVIQRGALWLGYAANRAPIPTEEQRGQELSELVGRELGSLQRLRSLSGRIAVAEAVNRQKSDFIAQMSHDIRSPLNNIKAILGLFTNEDSPTDAPELVRVAISNCDSMGEIVEGILDYSRHASGHLVAHPELVDLNDCVAAIVQSFAFAARQKNLTLIGPSSTQGTLRPFLVHADRRHLKRLITNLVSNAIKYTTRGSIGVAIAMEGGNCTVSVQDTGCGLSESQLQKLFTPFTRFHTEDAQMKSIEGIGLGLAVSRILAELNHGEISVASTINKGSCFTLRMPKAEQSEQILVHPTLLNSTIHERTTTAIAPLKHLRPLILLVDDDLDYLMSIERNLRQFGFDIRCANSVEMAIDSIQSEVPDVIITDGQMPNGGGRRVLEFIRTSGHQMPVLVASGNDDSHVVTSFRELGVNHVMTKPLEIAELVEWIKAQLPSNVAKDNTDALTNMGILNDVKPKVA